MLSSVKWYAKRYTKNNIYAARNAYYNGKHTTEFMHRVINSTPSNLVVDHINGNGLDNTYKNLRKCTQQFNSSNKRGVLGVTFNKRLNKWVAQICYKYKKIHIGTFINKQDALAAYQDARKKYFKF